MRASLRRSDLVEPELSYEVVGAVIDVYKTLGPGLRESTYQKGVARALTDRGFPFQEQVYVPIRYKGHRVGYIFLDFLIAGRVILELKRGDYFGRENIQQVKEYLTVTGLSLAIIANVTSGGVKFRRIVNIKGSTQ